MNNPHEELFRLNLFSQSIFRSYYPVRNVTRETVQQNIHYVKHLLVNHKPKNDIVDDVVRYAVFKFTEDAIQSGKLTPWMKNSRNLRRVVKGLNLRISEDQPLFKSQYFPVLLNAIENLENPTLIKPLARFVFQYWRDIHFGLDLSICNKLTFLINQLSLHNSKREGRQIALIKQYKGYLTYKDGPGKIALEIIQSNSTPQQYAIDNEWPSYMVSSQWMDALYIEYYQSFRSFNDSHEVIFKHLPDSKNIEVKKIILATLVSRYTGISKKNTKYLHTLAIESIGDPLSNIDWTLTNIWSDYQEDMFKAQSRLKAWINNEIVLFFFEKLGISEDRKLFWKQYAEKIPEIYILMNAEEWRKLKRTIPSDLKKRLESRIRVSHGGQTALIMYTQNHMLIEIANKNNAFYAYKRGGRFYIPTDKLYGIQKANDLKNPGLVPNYTINKSTMRLIHNDGWQNRMKQWLRIHADL